MAGGRNLGLTEHAGRAAERTLLRLLERQRALVHGLIDALAWSVAIAGADWAP